MSTPYKGQLELLGAWRKQKHNVLHVVRPPILGNKERPERTCQHVQSDPAGLEGQALAKSLYEGLYAGHFSKTNRLSGEKGE